MYLGNIRFLMDKSIYFGIPNEQTLASLCEKTIYVQDILIAYFSATYLMKNKKIPEAILLSLCYTCSETDWSYTVQRLKEFLWKKRVPTVSIESVTY